MLLRLTPGGPLTWHLSELRWSVPDAQVPADLYGSRAGLHHRPSRTEPRLLCRTAAGGEWVSRIGTPGRIFTGRGTRDAPERGWPAICKIPVEGSACGTCFGCVRGA